MSENALPKGYEPHAVEDHWREYWEKNKTFTPDPDAPGEPFSIVIPPPNVTGALHIGHALNHTLIDVLCRHARQKGKKVLWLPGTDHAGIATQNVVERALAKEGKTRHDLGREAFVERVWQWKEDYGNRILNQIRMLGDSVDWTRERFTMDEGLSKAVRKVFVELYKEGYIYKGKYIINWCSRCHTALADDEVDHMPEKGHLYHVRYDFEDGSGSVIIATTRPETIMADTGVCVHPEDERYAGLVGKKIVVPVIGRVVPLFADRYVDKEFGTGALKVTPCHDPNDWTLGERHGLEFIQCIDEDGNMTAEAGPYAGLSKEECRKRIVEDLQASGQLVKIEDLDHSVGHCYRCKTVVEPHMSEQWFVASTKLAPRARAAVPEMTQIFPENWMKTYYNWLDNIRDWCISRQRTWGVPIPAFYCKKCGAYHITDATIKAVSDLFRKEGSDAWYKYEAEQIIPAGEVCEKCGASEWTKDTDIMDVWFDSGSTHAAVLEERPELSFPADMYMEGGDQYRGWFQSSLLVAVGALGKGAPYRECLTHGWTVDGEGKAMHKSLGNGMDPAEIINEFGADMLRLWAGSADYHADMRCSKEIFKQLTQNYLKFRNTARYCLGNLDGFDAEHLVAPEDMLPLDRWAITKLNDLIRRVAKAYDNYEFHVVSHAINDFCVVELSSFYLDIIKDRLYCEERNGLKRRSAQTALFLILDSMTKMFAPILAFTCDEIWLAMPHRAEDDARNVLLNVMNQPFDAYALSEDELAKWDQLIRVRTDVNGVLEAARAEKRIGKPLEAAVTLRADDDAARAALDDVQSMNLPELLIVSQCLVGGDVPEDAVTGTGTNFPGLHISVRNAPGTKCPRCWMHSEQADPETGLCPRCAAVVAAQKAE